MFQKILRPASIALLAFGVLSLMIAIRQSFIKTAGPSENARLIAEQKAKSRLQCTPKTNKNCFTLTPAQLQQIKKIQNGLSRKKDQ